MNFLKVHTQIVGLIGLSLLLVSCTAAEFPDPVLAPKSSKSSNSRNTTEPSSPFQYALGPPDGLKQVNAALGSPLARTKVSGTADLQIKPPIAVYEIKADELVLAATLDAAHLARYHYLVEAAGESVLFAEVYNNPTASGGHATIGVGGPSQGEISIALAQLLSSDQTRGGAYEVRILRLLGVLNSTSTDVLWLKSESPGNDLIYPLPSTWLPLEAKKVYIGRDFLNLILPNALERAHTVRAAQSGGAPIIK